MTRRAIETNGFTRGVAGEELRRHNLAMILEHLHLFGPATRSQLTVVSGLNRSTVADLIGELETIGVVSEGPAGAASGPGRPSPVVQVKPAGAVVLAAEISVDSMAVAVVGLGGHIYDQIRIARPRGQFHPATTVCDIAELARPLLNALPPDHALTGVSVAVVGIVRRRDGFVHLAPNLGWRDLPLGEMIADELDLGVPVLIANDADLGALGEHRRGALSGTGHLVYVAGEVGIGCGVIIDGQPLLGSAGYGGEAGHTLVNPNGRKCRCGAIGCWETEAGEKALLRRVEALRDERGLEAVDAVVDLARAGDAQTLAAIAETGRWLGIGLSNLINVFNPDVIVLGGLYHRLFDYLETAVIEGSGRAIDASREMVKIQRSSVGSDSSLIGAAELALIDVMNDPAGVIGG